MTGLDETERVSSVVNLLIGGAVTLRVVLALRVWNKWTRSSVPLHGARCWPSDNTHYTCVFYGEICPRSLYVCLYSQRTMQCFVVICFAPRSRQPCSDSYLEVPRSNVALFLWHSSIASSS